MRARRRIEPGPGQESVWDYPRPPRLERSDRHVRVTAGDVVVADSHAAWRVLETSHPPVFYVPAADVAAGVLTPTGRTSYCEFKGVAEYWTVLDLPDAAWSYPRPSPGYAPMAGAVAFYPALLSCTVDGEAVRPQAGGFYGGWITDGVVGPFKGEPGTLGW
ncbi:MAG: hypothetical protein AVDCRST_MAG41-4355 [uncultured Corynebacteriales bacterium]|uniref:DUF427 domain-containing protein n=1 Tax=uncultured Mycobacteriales bacterium TaxID=581187 RepID=A0A6J4JZ06_9ACTN|nr:MAG: hypothetical protein AVDCRST_MAG41-4355 [uncultured Corynebacteriales bacterium]